MVGNWIDANMTPTELLLNRNSHARLVAPAPEGEALETILRAGLRAPDHAHLRPWRFLLVTGDRREALGGVLAESQRLRGITDEAAFSKARNAPLRAPLIIAGMLTPKEHPKVPRVEQAAAVACALHAMSLAAEAQGFGSMWRTGPYAMDPHVITSLGGTPGDEIIGFLYLGSKEGPGKLLPQTEPADYVSHF